VSRPLCAGERVVLLDAKGRRYLVRLSEGGRFHSHAGAVDHARLIGLEEGSRVRSATGASFVVVRPTLADVVLKMPRGAQVVYPKDLGAVLLLADVFPGARVVEAGVGSGALSMALVRAGADVTGYEVRADFAAVARQNVELLLGPEASYRVKEADVYDAIEERDLDRLVLDLPEPWRALPPARSSLRPGGIVVAFLPTINQTAQLRSALEEEGFGLAQTIEVLHRSWHFKGRSVRPDHRMVAHTGFLTQARLLAAG
jgi:tRNA (adenine57-N1/adenine58-N1)-methyltransferase